MGRVKKAAKELGYQPHRGARSLRGGKSDLIALAVPNLRIPYFADVANLVISSAFECGLTTLIDQTNGALEHEIEVIGGIRPQLIDGLICSPLKLRGLHFKDAYKNLPIVLLGENSPQNAFDNVAIDNVLAARDATHHLIPSLNKKRIVVVGLEIEKKTDQETQTLGWASGLTGSLRVQGYKQALRKNNIDYKESLALSVSDFTHQQGYLVTKQFLEKGIDFDAFFCFNDSLAIGAMKALTEFSFKVPDDIVVIGFDNSDEGAFHAPSITSVSPDIETLAKKAVSLLKDRIEGNYKGPARHIVVPHSIVFRESAPERIS